MLTDEDRARLLAAWKADLVPRVQRITGLPVVSVSRVKLHPEQTHSPEGFVMRVEDGRAVVVPDDPRGWRAIEPLLSTLGPARPLNRAAADRLLRALEEASRD